MKDQTLALVRHAVTFAGAALAQKGYIGEDQVEILAGAVLAAASIGWSAYEKWSRE
jgi:hypothetical protein